MTHQHKSHKISYENIYYLVGFFSGLFIGLTLEGSLLWIPILGLVGLLFTALFLTVFVRGRADA
jgi:hypothetical protein